MTSSGGKTPSLLDLEARGGDTAEGGFTFQDHLILARIPRWLARDGFASMIREALGDFEARFFDPRRGERLEFVEFKKQRLTPAKFWEELARFHELNESTDAYTRFELVCSGLSESLSTVTRALRRVRDAYPFYDVAPRIQDESYRDFVMAIESAGGSADVAPMLFEKVYVNADAPDANELSRLLFQGALNEAFSATRTVGVDTIAAAFRALGDLVKSRKNVPITRDELEAALWGALPAEVQPDRTSIRIHTANDPVQRNEIPTSLVFPWSQFFGGEERQFPPVAEWQRLVEDLDNTRSWITENQRPRRIQVTGHRRLSQSIALGSVFSAVAGFTLEVESRGETWSTADHPAAGAASLSWDVDTLRPGVAKEVAVSIGLLRNIAMDVERSLKDTGLGASPHLALNASGAIASGADANLAVRGAKSVVSEFLARCEASHLHLFVAVPSFFAVFLGHRLNATAIVHCYEFVEGRRYVPTCTLNLS